MVGGGRVHAHDVWRSSAARAPIAAGDPRLVFALVGQRRAMVDVAGGIEPAVVNSPHSAGMSSTSSQLPGVSLLSQADVVGS